jgi:hypothetical protein
MFRDRENQILHQHRPFFVSTIETRGLVPENSHIDVNPREEDGPLTHNAGGTTIQSFYRSILWQPVPIGLLHRINPTPIFFLTPEHDTISPTQNQIEIFEKFEGPKKFHLALGRGHVDILKCEDMPTLTKVQINFIWQVVKGRYKPAANGTANGTEAIAEKAA